jgi:hypothetical protein
MKNKKTLILVVFLVHFLSAGQNTNAVINLDLDPSTASIDSAYTAYSDSSTFTVALRISQIVTLKGYDVKITIDTSLFSFIQYQLNDSYNTNLLGPNPMSFTENLSDGVEVVASGAAVSASSGYLGTVTFKSKIHFGQSIKLSLSYAEITDANMAIDRLNNLRGGTYQVNLPKYTLTLVAAEHGTITSPAGSTISVTKDSVLQIQAVANSGYGFLKWELTPADAGAVGNLSSQNSTISIVKNATLTALFTPIVSISGKNAVSNTGPLSLIYEKDGKQLRVTKNNMNVPDFHVSIIDLKGKVLIHKNNTGSVCQINLTGIISGIYILKIVNSSGSTVLRFRI